VREQDRPTRPDADRRRPPSDEVLATAITETLDYALHLRVQRRVAAQGAVRPGGQAVTLATATVVAQEMVLVVAAMVITRMMTTSASTSLTTMTAAAAAAAAVVTTCTRSNDDARSDDHCNRRDGGTARDR